MPKCYFNKVASNLQTFANFVAYFSTPFPKNISGRLLLKISEKKNCLRDHNEKGLKA